MSDSMEEAPPDTTELGVRGELALALEGEAKMETFPAVLLDVDAGRSEGHRTLTSRQFWEAEAVYGKKVVLKGAGVKSYADPELCRKVLPEDIPAKVLVRVGREAVQLLDSESKNVLFEIPSFRIWGWSGSAKDKVAVLHLDWPIPQKTHASSTRVGTADPSATDRHVCHQRIYGSGVPIMLSSDRANTLGLSTEGLRQFLRRRAEAKTHKRSKHRLRTGSSRLAKLEEEFGAQFDHDTRHPGDVDASDVKTPGERLPMRGLQLRMVLSNPISFLDHCGEETQMRATEVREGPLYREPWRCRALAVALMRLDWVQFDEVWDSMPHTRFLDLPRAMALLQTLQGDPGVALPVGCPRGLAAPVLSPTAPTLTLPDRRPRKSDPPSASHDADSDAAAKLPTEGADGVRARLPADDEVDLFGPGATADKPEAKAGSKTGPDDIDLFGVDPFEGAVESGKKKKKMAEEVADPFAADEMGGEEGAAGGGGASDASTAGVDKVHRTSSRASRSDSEDSSMSLHSAHAEGSRGEGSRHRHLLRLFTRLAERLQCIETLPILLTEIPESARNAFLEDLGVRLPEVMHHQLFVDPATEDKRRARLPGVAQGVATNFRSLGKGIGHGVSRAGSFLSSIIPTTSKQEYAELTVESPKFTRIGPTAAH